MLTGKPSFIRILITSENFMKLTPSYPQMNLVIRTAKTVVFAGFIKIWDRGVAR
jgi:hypothetical protein